jgi:hypothetical protein
VSTSPPEDPAAALNEVLSEVIDALLDVRQASRRVPGTQALHGMLDRLFADLRGWAQLLAAADHWYGAASSEEVRRIVGEHLDRLAGHLAAALAEQQDDQVRGALTEVQQGILGYRGALSEL